MRGSPSPSERLSSRGGRSKPVPTLEERIASLEDSSRQGRDERQEIAETLEELTVQVAKLEVYLENANGGITVSVKGKRVKFAGSVSLTWFVGLLDGGSGAGWGLGRLSGAW